jgi:uncharacterized protein YodC (DUF2158 family)
MTFRSGDTVRLKSGGPLMTVNSVNTDGEVWCEWFDKTDKPQAKSFAINSLVADDGGPIIA